MQAKNKHSDEEPIHVAILKLEIKKIFLETLQKLSEQQKGSVISANTLIKITDQSLKQAESYIKKMWISATDRSDLYESLNDMVDHVIEVMKLDHASRKEDILARLDKAFTISDVSHRILKMKKEGQPLHPHFIRTKVPESKL